MKEETCNVLVLGSGPAGLAAAYRLVQAKKDVVILEKSDQIGGLMRSIRVDDFCVDIGRKELYNRFPEVHSLWSELLGDDYRTYPHRIGVLYGKYIIERSRLYRGYRRGIPWSLLVPAIADYATQRLKSTFLSKRAENEEEYWYRMRGRSFSVVLSQGYKEKFSGVRWKDRPPPQHAPERGFASLKSLVRRATVKDFNRAEWRHPMYGSGQIPEVLEKRIRQLGGRFVTSVEMKSLERDSLGVRALRGTVEGVQYRWSADSVVSTLKLGALAKLLELKAPEEAEVAASQRRSTLIVYLFVNEPPRFEHAWLDVTDPSTRVGRITNYAGFAGRMVPDGKTCLAAEIFTIGADPVLSMPDADVFQFVVKDLARADLIDPTKVFNHRVMRFPGAFAANDYRTWLAPEIQRFLKDIAPFTNLYDTHRAGTDVATFAGLLAADAILRGRREDYDHRADPAKPIGIEATRLEI